MDMDSGKEPACQCRRHMRLGYDPWVRKIPWSRKWQPTPVCLPGKFHGQRSLALGSQSRTRLSMQAGSLTLLTAPVASLFTLSALFAAPRVGQAWAESLEEDLRSHRSCKHVYSLLAGMQLRHSNGHNITIS